MPELTERISLKYENLSAKFIREVVNFTKQYSNIYMARLKTMNKLLDEAANKKWMNGFPVLKLHQLSSENRTKCIVIGTLFKDQKLKPSILKQMAKGNQLLPQPINQSCTDPSDKLYIEDDVQRYLLIGKIPDKRLVTGISCALLGTVDDKGRFQVDDYIFSGYREQIPRTLPESPAYVLFLSGLNILNSADCANSLEILLYWLMGEPYTEQSVDVTKIGRVIIAGNAIRNARTKMQPSISILSKHKETSESLEAVKYLDNFLHLLCQSMEVDLMPGDQDPSNTVLPQQPLHHCMLPKSAPFKSLNRVSNPYYCSVQGTKMLGTSGQPVKDIMAYSDLEDPLDVLESCLKWGHLSPTSPDTLGCLPFENEDPFILEDCPHVFFVGNQREFGTREVKGTDGQVVRLLSIPEFTTTLQVCLLDLNSLKCFPVSFGQ